ncbi:MULTISPECIES: antirestriction protein ArdA [Mycobacteriaceae]|uniref:Antirestriction protein ArdA n=1 Tax=Mycolicibacterium parafortuitum TaxID=39692 RepID=A0ACC6ME76_MYCPF|nr:MULTISPECIES: antirestriction protein ArdA [Mycobacteriaceae]MDZ5085212.1 antirestriction protein ArdA [Mycolicibacterium parafortuitum]GFM17896.1 antirestriction protein [Mycobacterium sp. PO1]GFM24694.1 antirestriction protein [Mycobacterium sp. PO2]
MNETHHEPTQSEPQPEADQQHETEPKPSPAIYIASLADYNNGILHGRWIDAAREPDAIQADIDAMLASSREPNAEEWAIHDYEQFGRWKVNEHDSVEQISRIAKNIAEHGYAYAAWADVFEGEEASYDIDSFHEAYLGHYDSVLDYVEQMADDLGYEDELAELPEHLQSYVRLDYGMLARDLRLSGDIATVEDPNGGVWIFRTSL